MIENLAAKLCLLLSENANSGNCREVANLLNGKYDIGVYQRLAYSVQKYFARPRVCKNNDAKRLCKIFIAQQIFSSEKCKLRLFMRRKFNSLCFLSRAVETTWTGERRLDTYWMGGGIGEERCQHIMYCSRPLRPD